MNQAIRKNLPKEWMVLVADGEKSLSNTLTNELIKVEDRLRRSCRKAVTKKKQPLAIIFTFQNGEIKPPIKRIKNNNLNSESIRPDEALTCSNVIPVDELVTNLAPPDESSNQITASTICVSFPRIASPEYGQSTPSVLLPQHVVPFSHVAPVQSPPSVVSSQRFISQQIDTDRFLNILTIGDRPSLNEGFTCVHSRYPTTEKLASPEMKDKPAWLIEFEKQKEIGLKEYDEKINKIITEMRAKISELREEKQEFEKRMQECVNNLMKEWVSRNKKSFKANPKIKRLKKSFK